MLNLGKVISDLEKLIAVPLNERNHNLDDDGAGSKISHATKVTSKLTK